MNYCTYEDIERKLKYVPNPHAYISLHHITKRKHTIPGWFSIGRITSDKKQGEGLYDIYLPDPEQFDKVNSLLEQVCKDIGLPFVSVAERAKEKGYNLES